MAAAELAVFDPNFEHFVFDPADDAALTRCAREFNFTPEDFCYIRAKRGDLVVLDPIGMGRQPVELRLVNGDAAGACSSFAQFESQFHYLSEPTVAIVEAGVATRQGPHIRFLVGDRLFWIRPGSFITPPRFFDDPTP